MTTLSPDPDPDQTAGANQYPVDYSLIAPVPVPDGLTAGPWRLEDGRPIRRLSDGSTQRLDGSIHYPVQDAATGTDSNTIVVVLEGEGTADEERLAVHCAPFEPDGPGCKGEKFLGIFYNREEEGFVILNTDQAARLAGLLVGDRTDPSKAWLPPGAEVSTDWDETNGEYRILSGPTYEVSPYLVRPYITQFPNGTFSLSGDHDVPMVFVDELRTDRPELGPYAMALLSLPIPVARHLAAVLVAAADDLDRWIGGAG